MRAKFRLESKLITSGHATLTFNPVTNGSPENMQFFKYTPSGNIVLSTINLNVAANFNPGDEVYVDFTLAEGANTNE